MLTLPLLFLLAAFVVAVVLGVMAWFRRALEWALLAVVLALWLLAQLAAAGARVG